MIIDDGFSMEEPVPKEIKAQKGFTSALRGGDRCKSYFTLSI